jgi:hypothetical protein
MPEMAVAARAPDLGPRHPVAAVDDLANMVLVDGLKKAWPAGAGFKFRAGLEERQAAEAADVSALLFVIE